MSKLFWYKCTIISRAGHKRVLYESTSYKFKDQGDYDSLGEHILDREGYNSGRVEFKLVKKLPPEVVIEKIKQQKAVVRYAIMKLRNLGCSWDEIRTYHEGTLCGVIDEEAAVKVAGSPV